MPVSIRRIKKNRYSVRTPSGMKARSTTKAKAEGLRRLLYGVEKDWRPTGKK